CEDDRLLLFDAKGYASVRTSRSWRRLADTKWRIGNTGAGSGTAMSTSADCRPAVIADADPAMTCSSSVPSPRKPTASSRKSPQAPSLGRRKSNAGSCLRFHPAAEDAKGTGPKLHQTSPHREEDDQALCNGNDPRCNSRGQSWKGQIAPRQRRPPV